jgi:aldehyde dehydrogenase (NAD+)
VYEEFLELFLDATKTNNHVGDPFSDVNFQGAQVSKVQHDKILAYIDDGKKAGAKLLHGGARHGPKGYFIEPTVFAEVSPAAAISPSMLILRQVTEDMKIVKEEIFGPVVTISKFSTEDEVVRKCNDSQYGLAAALFTEKVSRAHKVARKLQAGMVWINSSNDSHYGIPFGGYKSSGIGRELGKYALDAYTQAKAVHVNLGNEL